MIVSSRGFSPDVKLCLSDVILWLLEQCGRPQTECRHKCMELLYEFIPLLPGEQSHQMLHFACLDQFISTSSMHFICECIFL